MTAKGIVAAVMLAAGTVSIGLPVVCFRRTRSRLCSPTVSRLPPSAGVEWRIGSPSRRADLCSKIMEELLICEVEQVASLIGSRASTLLSEVDLLTGKATPDAAENRRHGAPCISPPRYRGAAR